MHAHWVCLNTADQLNMTADRYRSSNPNPSPKPNQWRRSQVKSGWDKY